MTERDSEWLEEMFEKYEDDYLEFEKVENPEHHRPDICAFIFLDKLVPGKGDIIAGAGHDIVHLEPSNIEELAKVATEEDILKLRRCGIHLEDGYLAMYV